MVKHSNCGAGDCHCPRLIKPKCAGLSACGMCRITAGSGEVNMWTRPLRDQHRGTNTQLEVVRLEDKDRA